MLATALTIKMVMYVVIAPLAAAYADRLPRRMFLTLLDVVRAAVVLALPFVTEIWQIYVLIGVLQAASAAFTPTFQAVIPDIVSEESDYTRALSASQVAYTMESLLSPVLAAVALTFMTFNWLFVGTSVGFVISAVLVLSTRIPNAAPSGQTGAWNRVTSGVKVFFATPRLRGVMALNVVVAAAGSIVVVNTVNYVRDQLDGTQADVAWMLAASGGGTLLVALLLPRVLDRVTERVVMMTGAAVLLAGVLAAVAMTAIQAASWMITASIWVVIGGGMALIVTPTGRVIRGSVAKSELRRPSRHSSRCLTWPGSSPTRLPDGSAPRPGSLSPGRFLPLSPSSAPSRRRCSGPARREPRPSSPARTQKRRRAVWRSVRRPKPPKAPSRHPSAPAYAPHERAGGGWNEWFRSPARRVRRGARRSSLSIRSEAAPAGAAEASTRGRGWRRRSP